jgi:predicted dithiol-disulfide oxidoreductase (DUF899 family)
MSCRPVAKTTKALFRIMSKAEWQVAQEKIVAKKKAATRARDALAGKRRRSPMVEIK